MAQHIARRDTLKLMSALTGSGALAATNPWLRSIAQSDPGKPNIIIVLIDTLSARHMSLYGYERQTTPNFERFASRATVYHSHYSGGNFTTPGTASLLTGLYPWSHRAINLGAPIDRQKVGLNIFNLVDHDFRKTVFAQNTLADLLLWQFGSKVNEHFAPYTFSDHLVEGYLSRFFPSDPILAHYAFDDFLIDTDVTRNPIYGASYLGYLDQFYGQTLPNYSAPTLEYPRGMPSTGVYVYDNRKVYSGVFQTIQELNKRNHSFLSYFHLLSPHSRYCPRKEFVGIFPEIKIPYKRRHKLGNHVRQSLLNEYRMLYDEYIADVDNEFGKLVDHLEAEHILDNSYLVVTSDHGELFERGENGHNSFLLYDSIIHIPLLISAPGQSDRRDFQVRTSSLDVLPTLLNLQGKEIPSSLEGRLLPGFGGVEEPNRSIFSVEAKTNSAFAPLKRATIAMQKENFKVIYYGDYPRYSNIFELYDIQEDPEEMTDLFPDGGPIASQLKEELLDTLSMANKPFAHAN